jgi:DNA-binding winged helix-turn-helix (wHTH) protein
MRYIFGDYTLDTERYELRHAGTLCSVEPQVFRVLVYLLAQRHRVVTKQELMEHLWPGRFVSDELLSHRLMATRKAIGDSGRTQRYIKTVHGWGYRFVAPVETSTGAPESMEAAAPTPPPASPQTLEHLEASPIRLPPPGPPTTSALPGERKQVTVLCCALADAQRLATPLEPETMYCCMQAIFALAERVVHRYEGTLMYYMEDGFVALFGAPVAQEDHARRAVLAALELRQRLHAPDALRGPADTRATAALRGRRHPPAGDLAPAAGHA